MADVTEGDRAPGQGGAAAPLLARLWTRETAISLAFAVLAFSVYWFLGPKETAYSFQVSQANNIIHGHLDLRPEHTRNLGVLEQVLYDGHRFCLRPDQENRLQDIVEYVEAIRRGASPDQARQLVISPTCKTYMQHSLAPSLVVIPGVLLWGKELNQTLVSAVIGALTAVVVYAVARRMTENQLTQFALTLLMLFGTIFWWVAANGGVWFFAHTMATFFLFGAIYFTIVRPNPAGAGALLGAAFMSRPTAIMALLFFVIMFSNLWLKPRLGGHSLPQRIDWRTVVQFAAGIAPFMLLTLLLNYVRYGNPFETGYNYVESSHQTFLSHMYNQGTLDISYIPRHPPVIFGAMPIFQKAAPYVLPSWLGSAAWITTPAFFYAYFPNIKKYFGAVMSGAAILAVAVVFMLSRAIAGAWHADWATTDLPLSAHLLPFWVMTAVAIVAGLHFRDRLVVACWAAIVPTALMIFSFAFVGYAQFGYRYALDFAPFLWLLVAHAIGDEMKWHHWTLIGLGIAVNLWGVLWIYQFQPDAAFGVSEWVRF
ncbi:MAG TPA: hypothetical protein VFP63_08585 [Dehalococcoidia bacterium]|nr:hypothetical protein [Dehalococcoidia bacterium]